MNNIIEVIAAGPQGPQGEPSSGDPLLETRFSTLETSQVQVLAKHDDTESTETVVLWENFDSDDYTSLNGAITVNIDIPFAQLQAELHLEKSGGGTATLAVWTELSFDTVTWFLAAGSLRQVTVSNDSEGLFRVDLSTSDPLPAGASIRFVVTNTGGGTITIQPSTPLTVSKGVVSGKASKLTLLYRRPIV